MEITFNTSLNKITVTIDGISTDYFNRSTYLVDHPGRISDCDAMGW